MKNWNENIDAEEAVDAVDAEVDEVVARMLEREKFSQLSIGEKVWFFLKNILYIPTCAVIIWLLVGVIFAITIIPTESMEPTYKAGSVTLGLRLVDEDNIERGTPIFFKFCEDDGSIVTYAKRVIGLPGETVSFSGGDVYINGSLLDESAYLADDVETYSSTKEFVVPEGSYFVLGDNRTRSYDSREWDDPYVDSNDVEGRLFFGN